MNKDAYILFGLVLGIWITSVSFLAFHKIAQQQDPAGSFGDCSAIVHFGEKQ